MYKSYPFQKGKHYRVYGPHVYVEDTKVNSKHTVNGYQPTDIPLETFYMSIGVVGEIHNWQVGYNYKNRSHCWQEEKLPSFIVGDLILYNSEERKPVPVRLQDITSFNERNSLVGNMNALFLLKGEME